MTSHKEIAEGYAAAVIGGEIVASRLVRAACQRHFDDLDRQSTSDFPYHFDEKKADHICQFFPLALKHSKGKWAGHPLELEPWQVFIFWTLFGWKRNSDDTRKYRRAHIGVGRKNGKSTLAAGLGLYGMMCDGEPGAEIYVAATKIDQARCIFTEAERMRSASQVLSRHTKNHINNIFCRENNSFFRPCTSLSAKDGPNPHMAIFDELHAWTESHRKFYNTMVTGGASRTQPMQITTTTAGDERSLIWKEEYDHCKGVVQKYLHDETIFAYIAEIDDDDDPLDPSCWIKANPNVGVSVSLEYMEQQARDAKNKPTFYPVFISKHCNKITSSKNEAFDRELWAKCGEPLSDWSQAEAFGAGIDNGGHDDLASYAIVARFLKDGSDPEKPIYRYEGRVRSFISEDTVRDLAREPFRQWIYEGRIKVEKYVSCALRDEILEDMRSVGCESVGYDIYNARSIGEELEQAGHEALKFPQTYLMYNEAIKELHEAVRTGRFAHGNDPVLTWAAHNAIIKKNKDDFGCTTKLPVKTKSIHSSR
jgi:phage terminase large subunit-like protein